VRLDFGSGVGSLVLDHVEIGQGEGKAQRKGRTSWFVSCHYYFGGRG
jgi:hypothetical protein